MAIKNKIFDILKENELSSAVQTNMSPREAKEKLDNYPDGFLYHEILEGASSIFKTKNNEYGIIVDDFDNKAGKENARLEPWDWIKDIDKLKDWDEDVDINTGWEYHPSTEFYYGLEAFDNLRDYQFPKRLG